MVEHEVVKIPSYLTLAGQRGFSIVTFNCLAGASSGFGTPPFILTRKLPWENRSQRLRGLGSSMPRGEEAEVAQ